ncbi:MAG TPA: TIGR02996 domain-containing protein [Gemmataceae bacterium]|nr:TIGR02996 domain-containing protein [Gemmataceae bacterium]
MHTDDDFLCKLLDNPADDTARLVYADWLDEQSDDLSRRKATFVRMTASLTGLGKKQRQKRKLLLRRLQQLAAELEPNWLAVVSRLKVENCAGRRARDVYEFEFLCHKRWDEMQPTNAAAVRFCDECQQNVHYCDTIMAARAHAQQGHCIAVDLGIIRREGDLEPDRRFMVLGRPGPEFYRREEERLKPDPVSQAREERKKAAQEPNTGVNGAEPGWSLRPESRSGVPGGE